MAPSENQSDSLPRSLSVPALAAEREGDQAAPRQVKVREDVAVEVQEDKCDFVTLRLQNPAKSGC